MDVRNPAPSEGRENGATVCTQASAGDDVPLKECDEMATECVSVFAWPARGKHLQLSVGMYTAMRNGQMSPVAKNNSEVWCGLKVGSLECVSLSSGCSPDTFGLDGNCEVGRRWLGRDGWTKQTRRLATRTALPSDIGRRDPRHRLRTTNHAVRPMLGGNPSRKQGPYLH